MSRGRYCHQRLDSPDFHRNESLFLHFLKSLPITPTYGIFIWCNNEHVTLSSACLLGNNAGGEPRYMVQVIICEKAETKSAHRQHVRSLHLWCCSIVHATFTSRSRPLFLSACLCIFYLLRYLVHRTCCMALNLAGYCGTDYLYF